MVVSCMRYDVAVNGTSTVARQLYDVVCTCTCVHDEFMMILSYSFIIFHIFSDSDHVIYIDF